jgi:predicted AAA+ superfamily ATPase
MKTFIKRSHYEKLIKPYIGKDLIKVLIGQRRVGKSYILKQTIELVKKEKKTTDKNILYIDKELYEFDGIRNYEDLIDTVQKRFKNIKNKKYLFIDEVQEIQEFHKAIRSLNANGDYDIYITGSNADILSSDIANSLGGRYISFKIYSLSYTEFLNFHKLKSGKKSLLKYLQYGGMPYLINLEENEELRYSYLKEIYSSILLKDIVSRYEIRNLVFLERLILFLADNTGSLFSAKSISDYLKSENLSISPSVIISYLKYLNNVFFIHQVSRSDVLGKKVFQTNEKYYFNDLGIRNALIGYRANDIAKILENLVYLELLRRYKKVTIGKLAKDQEIDFIAEKANADRVYVQVAYKLDHEKTIKRELNNLLSIKDNYPKILITMDELATGNHQGIKIIYLENFLLEEDLE